MADGDDEAAYNRFLNWHVGRGYFQGRVRAHRAILVPAFESLEQKAREADDAIGRFEGFLDEAHRKYEERTGIDKMLSIGPGVDTEEFATYKDAVGNANQIHADTAWMILLLSAVSLERLNKWTGANVFALGDEAYDGVRFSNAVRALSNAFKHGGEWVTEGPKDKPDRKLVRQLVDDETREDAALIFLERCGISDYEAFEGRLLSCSRGPVPEGGYALGLLQ